MKSLLICGPVVLLAAGAADAQSSTPPYDCQNVPMHIDIPAQPMTTALDLLTRQTRCPISREVDVSKLRSTAVKGTMKPVDAIVATVRGSGLEAKPVKQGLMVGRFDQRQIASHADMLERRISARQATGRLSAVRASALRRSLDQVRRQTTTLARNQGFISAAEKASFQRTFRAIGTALGA